MMFGRDPLGQGGADQMARLEYERQKELYRWGRIRPPQLRGWHLVREMALRFAIAAGVGGVIFLLITIFGG